jgi:hypothetical protein
VPGLINHDTHIHDSNEKALFSKVREDSKTTVRNRPEIFTKSI